MQMMKVMSIPAPLRRGFFIGERISTTIYEAAQLRGLFRFAGCGSPLLILRVTGDIANTYVLNGNSVYIPAQVFTMNLVMLGSAEHLYFNGNEQTPVFSAILSRIQTVSGAAEIRGMVTTVTDQSASQSGSKYSG